MCGRYLIDDEAFDLMEILAAAEKNLHSVSGVTARAAERGAARGEIFPGSVAPVVTKNQEVLFMLWGFPNLMAGKQPHINARSESAGEKKTFCEAMASRRCLVPATGYYEWKKTGNKSKEKYEFSLPDRESMYMAGIYSEDGRFAILTRAAAPSVASIHDRMPVILSKTVSDVWLNESADVFHEAVTELQFRHIPAAFDGGNAETA